MAIFKSNLLNEITKGICKKVVGHSQGAAGGIYFQQKGDKIIAGKKTNPTQRKTQKIKDWRRKFCETDNFYRQLTQRQKLLWEQYTQEYNRKTGENYSPHSLWMKLFLEGKMDEFLEKYMGWTYSDLKREEYENKICYEIWIRSKGYEGLEEKQLENIIATRR